MKVVLKLNNKLSTGIAPGVAFWGSVKGDIQNQTDLVEYVDSKISEIEVSGGSNGITEEELEAKGYLTSIPDEYITETELNDKGYLTTIPEEYAKKSDIPDVSAFITEIPEEYITSEELEAKGYLTEHQDISHLATKEELSGYQIAGDYLTSIPDEYMTWEETNDMFQSVSDTVNNVCMNHFQTVVEPELNKKLESIPEEYITEDELTAKGYATQAEMNAALGDIEAVLDEIIGEETV